MKRFILSLIALFIVNSIIKAQEPQSVGCGVILENEFTENGQIHEYIIELSAGSRLTTTGAVIGDTLTFSIGIFAPNGDFIVANDDEDFELNPTPIALTGIVSANGSYLIRAVNRGMSNNGFVTGNNSGIGVYSLLIGCTLRDGTVIEPGDSMPDNTTSNISNSAPTFSGFGFPGLASVDFSVGVAVPLTMDIANPGSISDGFDGIFGFTFDAGANEPFNLQFNRTAGQPQP